MLFRSKEQSTGKKEPDKDQYNYTDPESRMMKVRGSFEQSYNAQAAVEVATMFMRPPSIPIAGIHCGNIARIFWISLKK